MDDEHAWIKRVEDGMMSVEEMDEDGQVKAGREIAGGISGTRDGVDWPAVGEIISVPDDEAADLIRLGFAKPVDKNSAVPVVEKGVARTPEKRTLTKESTGL